MKCGKEIIGATAFQINIARTQCQTISGNCLLIGFVLPSLSAVQPCMSLQRALYLCCIIIRSLTFCGSPKIIKSVFKHSVISRCNIKHC